MATFAGMRIFRDDHGLRCPGSFELSWKHISLAFEFIYDFDAEYGSPWMFHIHLLFFNLFLHFPLWLKPKSKREAWCREWQKWGFTLCGPGVHFHWNEVYKIWDIPYFSKVHQRHEVRRADGSWVPFVGSWEQGKEPDGREEFRYPYAYRLRNGTMQHRNATVFVERRAWRPKWFTWTRLFENCRQSIDVWFNDEVGERTGSWKGGCLGCGYEMLPGETPEQTLRRMERERVFN